MEKGRKKQIGIAVMEAVNRYRGLLGDNGRPLSFVRFAWELSRYCRERGMPVSISYQSVKNWSDGRFIPDYLVILQIAEISPSGSWQNRFASDILAAFNKRIY